MQYVHSILHLFSRCKKKKYMSHELFSQPDKMPQTTLKPAKTSSGWFKIYLFFQQVEPDLHLPPRQLLPQRQKQNIDFFPFNLNQCTLSATTYLHTVSRDDHFESSRVNYRARGAGIKVNSNRFSILKGESIAHMGQRELIDAFKPKEQIMLLHAVGNMLLKHINKKWKPLGQLLHYESIWKPNVNERARRTQQTEKIASPVCIACSPDIIVENGITYSGKNKRNIYISIYMKNVMRLSCFLTVSAAQIYVDVPW